MKTVGFVCEGPRDSDMLEAIVRYILNEDINPLYLQPESSLIGVNGNGWKGVWTWCVKNGETFDQFIEGATPRPDMIIVQMDGDAARKEKEVHCGCFGLVILLFIGGICTPDIGIDDSLCLPKLL